MSNAAANLTPDVLPTPLRVDPAGTIRVGETRISLDVVVEQYESGMTPEEMVRVYDTLDLADIYDVIAYYLRHRDAVQAYLTQRAAVAGEAQAKVEAEHPPVSRGSLMARRTTMVNGDAPSGQ
jgi:uncharacterized protein (DUF433 family)